MKHLTESTTAKEFLAKAGLEITPDSAYNAITLVNADGDKLTLTAESFFGIAAGVPGIYIYPEE